MKRLYILLIAVLTLGFGTVRRASAQSIAFTEARFDSLQAAGALILVDIHAEWCPVCALQQVWLNRYMDLVPDSPIHFLKVDFDTQKEWVTEFEAPRQSTLILFRGYDRLWFSVAETREHVIFEQLDKAAFESSR